MGRRKNKWFKKTVNFYRFIFKFETPFKIIIDGNFIAISLKKKFNMKDLLSKTLDESVHLIIPSCIFKELQSLESKIPGITSLITNYKIEECPNSQLNPIECIKTYIGNKNKQKYFVATQDPFLRNQLRKIPGVPLLFFDQNMILIDKISKASFDASQRREGLKEDPQKKEKKELNMKKTEIEEFLMEEMKESKYYKQKMEEYKLNKLMGKIRKKAKGPNPLSVKKKKSYYEQKEIQQKKRQEEMMQKEKEASTLNNDDNTTTNNNNNNNETQNVEFVKRKRHRSSRKKNII